MNKISFNVQQAFETRFGSSPTHLICAPGRVNLIGEHTDYNGGFAMPLALEQAHWIAVRPRNDQSVILHSLDYDDSTKVNLTEPQLHLKGWQEYLNGVVWVLKEENWPLSGWEGVMQGMFLREPVFHLQPHLRLLSSAPLPKFTKFLGNLKLQQSWLKVLKASGLE